MAIFDPTAGPVIINSIEKGVSFEVLQALQNEKPIGAYRLDWTRAGAGIQTVVGHAHVGYVPLFVRQMNIVVSYTGRFTVFSDLWDAPAYDSAWRAQEQEWMINHRAQNDQAYLLVQTKLFAMAAAVAGAMIGTLHTSMQKRSEFEALVAKHGLPTKRPLPR